MNTYTCHKCHSLHSTENMVPYCAYCFSQAVRERDAAAGMAEAAKMDLDEARAALWGRTLSCVCGGEANTAKAIKDTAEAYDRLNAAEARVASRDALIKAKDDKLVWAGEIMQTWHNRECGCLDMRQTALCMTTYKFIAAKAEGGEEGR